MDIIRKAAWFPIQNRRVLFVRSRGNNIAYCAGGKLEEGETVIEALFREVKEEVGVALHPESVRYAETFTAPAHGHEPGTIVEIEAYFATGDGEPFPRGEIAELTWLSSADGEKTTDTGRLILRWLFDRGHID